MSHENLLSSFLLPAATAAVAAAQPPPHQPSMLATCSNSGRLVFAGRNGDINAETRLATHALDLSSTLLRSLPADMTLFHNLQRLMLTGNLFNDIPEILATLPRLKRLSLAKNPLASLGSTGIILEITTVLSLSESLADSIPMSVCCMPRLVVLIMHKTPLALIPASIGLMRTLTLLDLSMNQLCAVPPEIANLENLVWLNLNGNKLSKLPPEIGRLPKLQDLGISQNILTFLPDLSGAKSLKYLHSSRNKIKILGDWIMALPNLVLVDAAHNNLRQIPREIFWHPSLKKLMLSHNKLPSLPPMFRSSYDVSELPQIKCNIEELNVSFNELTCLPWQISQITWKKFIYNSNPWITPANTPQPPPPPQPQPQPQPQQPAYQQLSQRTATTVTTAAAAPLTPLLLPNIHIQRRQRANSGIQLGSDSSQTSSRATAALATENDFRFADGIFDSTFSTNSGQNDPSTSNNSDVSKTVGFRNRAESLQQILCNYFLRNNPLFAIPMFLSQTYPMFPIRLRDTLCTMLFCDFCEAPYVPELIESDPDCDASTPPTEGSKCTLGIRYDAILFRRMQDGHEMPLRYIFCSKMCKKTWIIRILNHLAANRSRFQPRDN